MKNLLINFDLPDIHREQKTTYSFKSFYVLRTWTESVNTTYCVRVFNPFIGELVSILISYNKLEIKVLPWLL